MEDFLGLAGLVFLCTGGSVEDRPGGERDNMEGKSSRGLGDWNGGIGSWFSWWCIGGNSTDECMRGCLDSVSEWLSLANNCRQ